jgi:hypothetical protein
MIWLLRLLKAALRAVQARRRDLLGWKPTRWLHLWLDCPFRVLQGEDPCVKQGTSAFVCVTLFAFFVRLVPGAERVPGAFTFLGIANETLGTTQGLHTGRFQVRRDSLIGFGCDGSRR